MKRKLCLILIITLYCDQVSGLKLKKVLAFGRHHLRGPISQQLDTLSPKKWPIWSVNNSDLTPKGELLEKYMGEYFSVWLHREGLLFNRCPDDNAVYIHSNYLNRTINSANAFAQAAFPGCHVNATFKDMTFSHETYDPIFPYAITNATDAYKQSGQLEMQELLNKTNLSDVYVILNNISDIRHSEICKNNCICDLTEYKDTISFHFGTFPKVLGRFNIAKSFVDAFLLSFYEGYPLEEVGWGAIGNEDDLKVLTKIITDDAIIRYNMTVMRNFMRPAVKYIKKATEDETLLTLFVGHDLHLILLMASMGFDPLVPPGQFEMIPMGSKLVFQKWPDGVKDYLKVELVYQTWEQIRNAQKLSLLNPPQNITMRLKTVMADKSGMYPWSLFEKLLNEI